MDNRLLHELCAVPTAPFAEQHVVEYVKRFVAARPRLTLRSDSAGNLLIELPARRLKAPRWVFTAHMDHPGCIAIKMERDGTLTSAFRGGVLNTFVKGAKVRFFDQGRDIRGKILKVLATDPERAEYPRLLRIKVDQPVSAGSPGMFDLPGGRIRGHQFHSRACDDLAGAAACLT